MYDRDRELKGIVQKRKRIQKFYTETKESFKVWCEKNVCLIRTIAFRQVRKDDFFSDNFWRNVELFFWLIGASKIDVKNTLKNSHKEEIKLVCFRGHLRLFLLFTIKNISCFQTSSGFVRFLKIWNWFSSSTYVFWKIAANFINQKWYCYNSKCRFQTVQM